jgi:hypothetical protein
VSIGLSTWASDVLARGPGEGGGESSSGDDERGGGEGERERAGEGERERSLELNVVLDRLRLVSAMACLARKMPRPSGRGKPDVTRVFLAVTSKT